MPWSTNLQVSYHQQNTREFCGPATAMMIVDALNGGLIQEGKWWDKIGDKLEGWHTDPKSLEKGLNEKAPVTFVWVPSTNEPDGTRTLVEALCTPNPAPAAALVYRKSHWIVVCNVNLSAKPAPAAAPAVLGFYVNDPSPSPLDPPQDHAKHDQCATSPNFGSTGANQYLSYYAWTSKYFNGYRNGAGDVFTIVCKKNRNPIARLSMSPAPFAAIAPAAAIAPTAPLATIGDRCPARGKEPLTYVDPSTARSDALRAIKEHGLDRQEPLEYAVRNVTAGEPELVHQLDAVESHYYLIPLMRDRSVVGIARMDAVHSHFIGVSAVRRADCHVPTADDIAKRLPPDFRIVDMVWRPCQESTSPYSPFYRAVGPDGELYIDRNGTVFRYLTPLKAGD